VRLIQRTGLAILDSRRKLLRVSKLNSGTARCSHSSHRSLASNGSRYSPACAVCVATHSRRTRGQADSYQRLISIYQKETGDVSLRYLKSWCKRNRKGSDGCLQVVDERAAERKRLNHKVFKPVPNRTRNRRTIMTRPSPIARKMPIALPLVVITRKEKDSTSALSPLQKIM
jgi:hypothetical protein